MGEIKDVVFVHIGNILLFPPALSAVNLLAAEGRRVTVITTGDHSESDYRQVFPNSNIDVHLLDFPDPLRVSLAPKIVGMLRSRKDIWSVIDEIYLSDSTLIWVSTVTSIKYLGMEILNRNFVFHVMELAEKIQYTMRLQFPVMDAERIGNAALAVIVPEKTRAHITQAWWNLRLLPLVLPNKPIESGSDCRKQLVSDLRAFDVLAPLKNRKIVLYQGIIHKERPLKPYLDAVEMLGEGYAFVTMGAKNPLAEMESPYHAHVPYIAAPRHLEVTSNAHIGVLSYFPFKGHTSVLNPLFCAPNKTFEYAKFGIPMLANDNPNLNHIFERWGCGKTLYDFEGEAIAHAIEEIDDCYDDMSIASRAYYDSIDMSASIRAIMTTVETRLSGKAQV